MVPSEAVKRVSPFHRSRPTFLRHIPTPPAGYVAPPIRIDHETVTNSEFSRRMALYQRAYATISTAEWKHYSNFGIQTFESYELFFQTINSSSEDQEHLRIAQYYKFHLENNIVVPPALLKRVGEIEIIFDALSIHEGFLHLSVSEMDFYFKRGNKTQAMTPNTPDTASSFIDRKSYPDSPLPGSDEFNDDLETLFDDDDISMHIPDSDEMNPFETSPFGKGMKYDNLLAETVTRLENKFDEAVTTPLPDDAEEDSNFLSSSTANPSLPGHAQSLNNHLSPLADSISNQSNDAMKSSNQKNPRNTNKNSAAAISTPPRINKALKQTQLDTTSCSKSTPVYQTPQPDDVEMTSVEVASGLSNEIRENTVDNQKQLLDSTLNDISHSSKTNPIIRIEVRWAPKDFSRMRSSSSFMYERLAPIISQFNYGLVRLAEWQSDQLSEANQPILPSDVSKFLSVRIVTATKQKCFFFSFRVKSTGQNFIKSLKTKAVKILIKGESIQFAPSMIDCTESEIVSIGDILLKDAEVTHRQKYVEYLRAAVLPPDTPQFDIKVKRLDPLQNKTQILTVKCSIRHTTKLTKILSEVLNGENEHPEIFISNIGLTKHKTSRVQYEQIYRIHQDFLADIKRIEFPQTRFIDTPSEEHLDSGEVISRTPRQWAKQLKDEAGIFCGIDLENGATDGKTYLLVPSHHLALARQCLMDYARQKNPALMKAATMCSQVIIDPDIPSVVFTKNISKILSKSFGKQLEQKSKMSFTNTNEGMSTNTSVAINQPVEQANAWSNPISILQSNPSSLAQACAQQESSPNNTPTVLTNTMSSLTQASREQKQLARIADLEARLESVESKETMQSINSNPSLSKMSNESDSTSTRLQEVESSLRELKEMLKMLVESNKYPHSVHTASTVDASFYTDTSEELLAATATGQPTPLIPKKKLHRPPDQSNGNSPSTLPKARTDKSSSLAVALKIRETNPSTSEYSQLTILTKSSQTETLPSPQVTPLGKKRRTEQKSPKQIIPMLSQYAHNDHSDEMSE